MHTKYKTTFLTEFLRTFLPRLVVFEVIPALCLGVTLLVVFRVSDVEGKDQTTLRTRQAPYPTIQTSLQKLIPVST